MSHMTIKIRSISQEESEILNHWQRSNDVVGYRRARILRLSESGWECADIASVLGIHIETVRRVITNFNEGGMSALVPQPRAGGR